MDFGTLARIACHEPNRGIVGRFSIDASFSKLILIYSGCELVFQTGKFLKTIPQNMVIENQNEVSMRLAWNWHSSEDFDTKMKFRVSLVFLEKQTGVFMLTPTIYVSPDSKEHCIVRFIKNVFGNK